MLRSGVFFLDRGSIVHDPEGWMLRVCCGLFLARLSDDWRAKYPSRWAAGKIGGSIWYYHREEPHER